MLPKQLRHLTKCIQIATKAADWQALKCYDLQLRELLVSQKPFLKDPNFAPEVQLAQKVHTQALLALEESTNNVKRKMNTLNAHQERAIAYQLAMTMELN